MSKSPSSASHRSVTRSAPSPFYRLPHWGLLCLLVLSLAIFGMVNLVTILPAAMASPLSDDASTSLAADEPDIIND